MGFYSSLPEETTRSFRRYNSSYIHELLRRCCRYLAYRRRRNCLVSSSFTRICAAASRVLFNNLSLYRMSNSPWLVLIQTQPTRALRPGCFPLRPRQQNGLAGSCLKPFMWPYTKIGRRECIFQILMMFLFIHLNYISLNCDETWTSHGYPLSW